MIINVAIGLTAAASGGGFYLFAQDVIDSAAGGGIDPIRHIFEASVLAGVLCVYVWLQHKRDERKDELQRAEREKIADDAREREDRTASRVTSLEDTINTKLLEHGRECVTAIAQVTQATSKMCEVIEDFQNARPCLAAEQQYKELKKLIAKHEES